MTQPTQLDPTEQDTLVKQIGLALLRAAPPEWQQVVVHYRAVGRYHEMTAELTCENEDPRTWPLSPDMAGLFARLRAGMYREGRGTWFNARYQLDRPSSYNLEYDREEPEWDNPPPPPAYPDELQMFPREDENIPEWLSHRLATQPAPPPPPPMAPPMAPPATPPGGFEPSGFDRQRFRIARTFDGMGPQGRPIVNRAPLDELDTEAVLAYLDDAPLAMPGRGYDVDRLDPEGRNSVPIAFHTDGTWVWPASVNYYLRTYGVSPEPDLVTHIRRHGFEVPEVDEATVAEAAAFVNRGAPPPPPAGRPMAPPPPPPPAPPAPPVSVPPAVPQPPTMPAVPAVPAPTSPGPALNQLRAKFADLGVPESVYRIGPPVERTWTLERVDEHWRVGWFERDQYVSPSDFDDVADATAFLLGKVLLDGPRPALAEPAPVAPPPAAAPPPPPPPPPAPPAAAEDDDLARTVLSLPPLSALEDTDEREPVSVPTSAPSTPDSANATAMMPAPGRGGSGGGSGAGGGGIGGGGNNAMTETRPQDWPIQPLYGEPPLTLFRGKRMIELHPGTEIDRFGEGDGNLTYAVGTPFPLRSLVPDWVNREYRVYRVQQSFEALTGVAIPWFEQPGGGTAFLLPHAVEDLIEDGYLVEIPGREPPPLT